MLKSPEICVREVQISIDDPKTGLVKWASPLFAQSVESFLARLQSLNHVYEVIES